MVKRVIIFLLTIGLVFPFPLFSAMIGEFAVVNGDVTVNRAGKIIKPKVKDKVETLDFIQTGKNSNARVVLSDETAMALGPNSRLEMKQFTVQGGKTTGLFSVPAGLVQTNVVKALGPGSRFEIQTPTSIAGVRGTAWITLVEAFAQAGVVGTKSTFYGLSQSIFVLNPALPAQIVTVAAGNFTVVAAGVAPTAAAAFSPAVVTGLTSQLGAAAIPGVGATGAAGASTVAGTAGASTVAGTAGATSAGAVAASATVAGVNLGTIATVAVLSALVIAAAITSASKEDNQGSSTTHSSSSHHSSSQHH